MDDGGGWTKFRRSSGLVEHVCEHGVGHPDPGSVERVSRLLGHDPGTWRVHGCDGCCGRDDFPGREK